MTTDAEKKPVRVLLIEDLEVDAERALHQLKRAGMHCEGLRVQTGAALQQALDEFQPDVILSDFSLPQFDGMEALAIARERAPQIPFLFLSGTIGEERAIHALHSGAVDYVLKDNLARLAPAVRRAIADAAAHAERVRQEAQIARLHRVLRMLSGVNGLVLRIRDRAEVLRETCKLATSTGGYGVAVAVAKSSAGPMQPLAWSGDDLQMTEDLRAYVAGAVARPESSLGQVIATGREFVCNNTTTLHSTGSLDQLMVNAGVRSVVALPLVVDSATVGLLVLAARDVEVVGVEELGMLREVAGNLSFGLKYLHRDVRARFLSHFDANTGLAKRPLFTERVQRLISSPSGRDGRFLVIAMDVERLTFINDSIGWQSTDLLLQQVAERLRRFVPRADQIGHLGGGTFVLVRPVEGDASIAQLQSLSYRKASEMFGEPFVIDGQTIPVAVRTGFALYPDDDCSAATLVQGAEAALRHARTAGEQHVHFDASVKSLGVGRLALEHRLRFALEKNEFELHYQPKVDVRTCRIVGAEALLRWRSPEDGLVMPSLFLPLLETTGMMLQVGSWVVRQAARDCRAWRDAGLAPVRVAVNIAPAQLRYPEFAHEFLQCVREWSTAEHGLDIEITEGVLHEDSAAEVDMLQRLHENGVRIAIDDFGTGYSSLSRLAQLPIDTLKIDRHFISQLLTGASGGSVVRTIIALAGAFGMTTVAEGVETAEQLAALAQLGCQQSQGYLHSAAVPAEKFARMLARGAGPRLLPAADAMPFTVRSSPLN